MEDRSSRPSRRCFLSTAVAAAAALAAKPAKTPSPDPERERLACVLAEYGSELGDVRNVEEKE